MELDFPKNRWKHSLALDDALDRPQGEWCGCAEAVRMELGG